MKINCMTGLLNFVSRISGQWLLYIKKGFRKHSSRIFGDIQTYVKENLGEHFSRIFRVHKECLKKLESILGEIFVAQIECLI